MVYYEALYPPPPSLNAKAKAKTNLSSATTMRKFSPTTSPEKRKRPSANIQYRSSGRSSIDLTTTCTTDKRSPEYMHRGGAQNRSYEHNQSLERMHTSHGRQSITTADSSARPDPNLTIPSLSRHNTAETEQVSNVTSATSTYRKSGESRNRQLGTPSSTNAPVTIIKTTIQDLSAKPSISPKSIESVSSLGHSYANSSMSSSSVTEQMLLLRKRVEDAIAICQTSPSTTISSTELGGSTSENASAPDADERGDDDDNSSVYDIDDLTEGLIPQTPRKDSSSLAEECSTGAILTPPISLPNLSEMETPQDARSAAVPYDEEEDVSTYDADSECVSLYDMDEEDLEESSPFVTDLLPVEENDTDTEVESLPPPPPPPPHRDVDGKSNKELEDLVLALAGRYSPKAEKEDSIASAEPSTPLTDVSSAIHSSDDWASVAGEAYDEDAAAYGQYIDDPILRSRTPVVIEHVPKDESSTDTESHIALPDEEPQPTMEAHNASSIEGSALPIAESVSAQVSDVTAAPDSVVKEHSKPTCLPFLYLGPIDIKQSTKYSSLKKCVGEALKMHYRQFSGGKSGYIVLHGPAPVPDQDHQDTVWLAPVYSEDEKNADAVSSVGSLASQSQRSWAPVDVDAAEYDIRTLADVRKAHASIALALSRGEVSEAHSILVAMLGSLSRKQQEQEKLGMICCGNLFVRRDMEYAKFIDCTTKNIVSILLHNQRFDLAIATLQTIKETSPDDSPMANLLGLAYLATDNYERASRIFLEILQIIDDKSLEEPKSNNNDDDQKHARGVVLNNLACCFLKKKEFDQSSKLFERSLDSLLHSKDNANIALGLCNFAKTLVQKQSYDMALESLETSIEYIEEGTLPIDFLLSTMKASALIAASTQKFTLAIETYEDMLGILEENEEMTDREKDAYSLSIYDNMKQVISELRKHTPGSADMYMDIILSREAEVNRRLASL